jgi:hypothetical protein
MKKAVLLRWVLFHATCLAYFSILMAVTAHADPIVTIDASVDFANCDVSEKRPGVFQVTSKIDGSSTEVSTAILNQKLEPVLARELRRAGIEHHAGGGYEVHLSCSSIGPTFAINIPAAGEAPALCVRTDHALSALEVTSNNEQESGKSCLGERPERLLIGIANPVVLPALLSELKESSRAELIEAGEIEGPSMVVLKLQPAYRFREGVVRAKLKEDASLSGLLEYVDFDRVQTIVGSSRPLLRGTYHGF